MAYATNNGVVCSIAWYNNGVVASYGFGAQPLNKLLQGNETIARRYSMYNVYSIVYYSKYSIV